ncbi:hypothetical protein KC725_01730 [Candidatus Peregrinibacteria bacterium]|nr:hypothetical protein [Candidatus Peregrinibacteria bacterium]
MSHPDRTDDFPKLDTCLESFSDDPNSFVGDEEIPTQRFNDAVHNALKDDALLDEDEPTRILNLFEILRSAFRKADLSQLEDTLQTINLLFLNAQIDPVDLAFDMDQVNQWFGSPEADKSVHVNLSDNSYVRITIEGPKDHGEPTLFFSNTVIQRQFEIVEQSPVFPGV